MADLLLVADRLERGDLELLEVLTLRLLERRITSRLLVSTPTDRPIDGLPTDVLPAHARRFGSGRDSGLIRALRGRPPRLIHGLGARSASRVLNLAESLGSPYLLTIDGFLQGGQPLRISRALCRGLIAREEDVARDLVEGWRVPRALVGTIPLGVPLAPSACASGPCVKVPVVGVAFAEGNPEAESAFFEAARLILDSGIAVEFLARGNEGTLARWLAARWDVRGRVTYGAEALGPTVFWDVTSVFVQVAAGCTSGRKVGHAMAAGMPVVASDVPGPRRWIDHGRTGLLVPRGSPEALAQAILRLLSDPDGAARLGLAARSWVAEHHRVGDEASRLADLYHRLIHAPGSSEPIGRIGRGLVAQVPCEPASASRRS